MYRGFATTGTGAIQISWKVAEEIALRCFGQARPGGGTALLYASKKLEDSRDGETIGAQRTVYYTMNTYK